MRMFDTGGGRVRSLALSPDGQTLATSMQNRCVRLWHLGSNPPKAETIRTSEAGCSRSLVFSSDGSRLAGWEPTNSLWTWNLPTRELEVVPVSESADPPRVRNRACLAVLWHENELLDVSQLDGIWVWDRQRFRAMLAEIHGWRFVTVVGSCFAVLHEGVGIRGPCLTVFDMADLPPVPAVPWPAPPDWFRHGSWPVPTPTDRPLLSGKSTSLVGMDQRCLLPIAVMSGGAALLTVDELRKTVRQVDTATRTECAAWCWPLKEVCALAVSPEGLTAAAGDSMGRVVLWDLA